MQQVGKGDWGGALIVANCYFMQKTTGGCKQRYVVVILQNLQRSGRGGRKNATKTKLS